MWTVMEETSAHPNEDRRQFPRLMASFDLRFGICGSPGEAVPGYTRNLGLGGISFVSENQECEVGGHVALEINVPGYDDPLYVLGVIKRVERNVDEEGRQLLACSFDWLGKTDRYREKLAVLTGAHSPA